MFFLVKIIFLVFEVKKVGVKRGVRVDLFLFGERWGVSLCETKGGLLLFGAAKSNQKLLVAEKASAFSAKRSLQKQNSSFVVGQLFLLRCLIR
jgi:hypothetical protein